ncbi:MAG: thiamine-phosphate kinase [Nitrososphaerota archaeon]
MNEEEIIRLFIKKLGRVRRGYLPLGDDVAAYFLKGLGKWLVAKADMLVASTDIPPGMSLVQAGRKALAMSVSDFAAKGVKPLFALVSMGLPKELASRAHVKRLADGISLAAREFGFKIAGGDTNEAKELVLDACLVGLAAKIVPRSTAQVGDLVAVTGPFGYSAAGLEILLGGIKPISPEERLAVSKVMKPEPPLKLGLALAEQGIVTSSIDSSDGLALSLHHLAEASHKRINLHGLPTDEGVRRLAARLNRTVEELALYGGEELEIVYTLPISKLKAGRRLARRFGKDLLVVGRVTEGSGVAFNGSEVERRGWLHFRRASRP